MVVRSTSGDGTPSPRPSGPRRGSRRSRARTPTASRRGRARQWSSSRARSCPTRAGRDERPRRGPQRDRAVAGMTESAAWLGWSARRGCWRRPRSRRPAVSDGAACGSGARRGCVRDPPVPVGAHVRHALPHRRGVRRHRRRGRSRRCACAGGASGPGQDGAWLIEAAEGAFERGVCSVGDVVELRGRRRRGRGARVVARSVTATRRPPGPRRDAHRQPRRSVAAGRRGARRGDADLLRGHPSHRAAARSTPASRRAHGRGQRAHRAGPASTRCSVCSAAGATSPW